MSAYICDKNHILYLVESAMEQPFHSFHWHHNDESHSLPMGDVARAADVANMLWRENLASVSALFPNERTATLPGDYVDVVRPDDFNAHVYAFSPVQIIKACNCYEYQTCEHDGWKASEANAFIDTLRRKACTKLPGYEAAEWGAPEKTAGVSLFALASGRRAPALDVRLHRRR